MPDRKRGFHDWLSRILAGGALGCGVLLVGDLVLLWPFWKPLLKSDERWQTAFFIAKVGLPAAFVLGALAGLVWRRSHTLRLSHFGLVCCCLAIALVSIALRPVVARIRTNSRGPLYEVIPDTMAAFFCVVALVIAVWHAGQRLLSGPVGEGPGSPAQEDADPGVAEDRPRE
jgi:hypothetical protein